MISKDQIIMIQTARRRAGLDEAAWRILLGNVGGVTSCKDLDNVTFEDCMAMIEDHAGSKSHYWRETVAKRGTFANRRMVHKIHALFAEYASIATAALIPEEEQYKLPGLCARESADRERTPERLNPYQAYNLIESLKDIVERTAVNAEPPAIPGCPRLSEMRDSDEA